MGAAPCNLMLILIQCVMATEKKINVITFKASTCLYFHCIYTEDCCLSLNPIHKNKVSESKSSLI